MKNLLIVESPTKAKTIGKYLNNKFIVIATRGHIRDLPKKILGLDLKNNFSPTFYFLPGRKKIAEYINKKAIESEIIYIATDPDREGEAIGWHVTQVLYSFKGMYRRLLLHEITEDCIKSELSNSQEISQNLVDAQFARRIVDRLFGFFISPIVSRNIKERGSAGRVQSPTLRLIYERDKEIKNFKGESFLDVKAQFMLQDNDNIYSIYAKLKKWGGYEKIPYREEFINEIKKEVEKNQFSISDTNNSEMVNTPPPPFNTSSLLIQCAKSFKWPAYKTMKVAQILYEGVRLGNEYKSLITYIRTDSLRMNEKFIQNLRKFIQQLWVKKYIDSKVRKYASKDKFAQDAHEAIRPVNIDIIPESIKDDVTPDIYKLYEIIWKRTIATQLRPAILSKYSFEISNQSKNMIFLSENEYLIYNGYKVIYGEEQGRVPEYIKNVKIGESVELQEIEFNKVETKPPVCYTEGALIKELKKLGIGRPSTYVQIIYTLLKREHIKKVKGYLQITEKGVKTIEFLLKKFSGLVDYRFTKKLEKELDQIAMGEKQYIDVISDFYNGLKQLIAKYKILRDSGGVS